MLDLLHRAAAGALPDLGAVGIAATGPVERSTSLIHNPFNLPDWSDDSWPEELAAMLDVPVVLDNDAMGAAVGELQWGAGRGAGTLCMVTLGTGIGVAVVSRSSGPYRGTSGFHPEAGHIIIGGASDRCYCGELSCWEELCSGSGIRKYWTEESGRIDWNGYGEALARGIRNLSRVYAPDVIVVGGGISANYDDFIAPVLRAVSGQDPMGPPGTLAIRPAELPDPGTFGAAEIAYQAIATKEKK
jgi:glucokinase